MATLVATAVELLAENESQTSPSSPSSSSSFSSSSNKASGYKFFERIGSPKYVTAPMVDHSGLSYRMLTRTYGATLVYTQMFSSNCFAQSQIVRDQLFQTCPEDRPLIVQFAGHDPEMLLAAAKYVEDHCDAVDINLGCPQGIAKRGRYGAFLMEELGLLHDIVSTLVAGLKIPVTCKTRIYRNDFERSILLCETLVNAGASMLTIHGRSRNEKGSLVAEADWTMIQRIKAHFAGRVPIIANGGIETLDDVHRCIEMTGVDGVMSSEAILENPALFANNNQQKTMAELADEYLQMVEKYPHGSSMKSVRQHIMKFCYKYFVRHVDLRDRAGDAKTLEQYQAVIAELLQRVGDSDAEYTESWYRRHRSNMRGNGTIRASEAVHTAQDQFWSSVEDVDGDEGGGEGGAFESLWG